MIIQELARQATSYCDGLDIADLHTYNQIWQREFAELIVLECAEVAGCNAHVSGFALGDLILQRFGVEPCK